MKHIHLHDKNILANDKSARYNPGNGKGFFVNRPWVIDVAKDVSGNNFIVSIETRLAGDLQYSLPMSRGQKMDFTGNRHWQTAFAELQDIVKTAWRWGADFLSKH